MYDLRLCVILNNFYLMEALKQLAEWKPFRLGFSHTHMCMSIKLKRKLFNIVCHISI